MYSRTSSNFPCHLIKVILSDYTETNQPQKGFFRAIATPVLANVFESGD